MMISTKSLTVVVAVIVAVAAASSGVSAFQTTVPFHGRQPSLSLKSRLHADAAADATTTAESFDLYDTTNAGQPLEWKDVQVGDGPVIEKDDLITVKHIGTVMESGKSLGEHTFQFQYLEPGRVMPGWSQGMEGMKVGGRRKLRIPPRLGYGNRAVGSLIPANSHLEFDVEVLEKDDSLWALFLYKTGFKADARTAGILFFLSYLALSPIIEQKLNGMM